MTDLIPIEEINAIAVFAKGGIDSLLKRIDIEASTFVPDVETPSGRKEIASLARKVASSKVFLDKAGKELVKGWKDQAKVVDAERRKARDFLDDLRDKIRKPLTEYEEEQERIVREAREAEERKQMLEEAHAEHNIWNRERLVEKQQRELKEAQDKLRIEEEERQAKLKAEARERDIKREAREKAQIQ